MRQIETVDRFEKAAEPLLEEVGVGDSPIAVPLGDVGHQPHVGKGQFGAELEVALKDGFERAFDRAVIAVSLGDESAHRPRVVGLLRDNLSRISSEGRGQCPLAIGQLFEQPALPLRAEHRRWRRRPGFPERRRRPPSQPRPWELLPVVRGKTATTPGIRSGQANVGLPTPLDRLPLQGLIQPRQTHNDVNEPN